MCFNNESDGDWVATVVKETDGLAIKPDKCDECGAIIPVGSPVHEIYMEQHERCQICQDEDSESFIGQDDEEDYESEEWRERMKTLEDHACDYGESFAYSRCDACDKLLKAIESMEEKEGCPPHSRRPLLLELGGALYEHESKFQYAEYAVDAYPELWSHPFIIKMLDPKES